MRKILILIAMVLLCAAVVSAAICTETDNGRDYSDKGSAKYAITEKYDICVISPQADVRQDSSQYLKEYYCKEDEMKYEIIDCAREGFETCEFGECVGGSAGADSNYTGPPVVIPKCGNQVVDEGEDCDPMNKICFDDDGNIGLCDKNCQCEVKIKRGEDEEEPEENITEELEEEEEVIEEEPEEVIEEEPEEEEEEITVTIAEKPKKEEKPKGFFARLWAWITGLFS